MRDPAFHETLRQRALDGDPQAVRLVAEYGLGEPGYQVEVTGVGLPKLVRLDV